MIKYLGSKRTLVPVLGAIATAVGAQTAVDLFTGTTRVAQEFKRRGIRTTAVDSATYAEVFARCYIATDAQRVDPERLTDALAQLSALPGRDGYVTRTFCEQARYFQPHNGRRIDAIRDALEADWRDDPLYPVLLTSLILAADRVDSTTGIQMAYLKQWAARSYADLELRAPVLLDGPGAAVRGDALEVAGGLPAVDLAYLDPPYNQHRYFTNYHVWETLVRWDAPETYGVALKRLDARDPATKSPFNSRPGFRPALQQVLDDVRADVVVLSYNDESWVDADELEAMLHASGRACVRRVEFDFKRYVGAQIGIYDPTGKRVGEVSHLRNREFLFLAGDPDRVDAGVAAVTSR